MPLNLITVCLILMHLQNIFQVETLRWTKGGIRTLQINYSKGVIAKALPGHIFWSTGLTKEHCLTVKKGVWPGKNKMDQLLKTLKKSIIEKNNDE